jgi:hypothetical protein
MVEVQFHVRHFSHHFWNDFYRTVIEASSRREKKSGRCADFLTTHDPLKLGMERLHYNRAIKKCEYDLYGTSTNPVEM